MTFLLTEVFGFVSFNKTLLFVRRMEATGVRWTWGIILLLPAVKHARRAVCAQIASHISRSAFLHAERVSLVFYAFSSTMDTPIWALLPTSTVLWCQYRTLACCMTGRCSLFCWPRRIFIIVVISLAQNSNRNMNRIVLSTFVYICVFSVYLQQYKWPSGPSVVDFKEINKENVEKHWAGQPGSYGIDSCLKIIQACKF